MKNLKTLGKALITLTLVALTLVGCSRSDNGVLSDQRYFLKFTIDGNKIEFTETTVYSFDIPTLLRSNSYSISGGDGDSGFTINLGALSPLAANDTFDESLLDSVPNGYLSYSLSNDSIYTYSSWITPPYESVILPCTVKISEVTDTNIKGTFFGEMRELRNENHVTVTNGSFNVKRVILSTN